MIESLHIQPYWLAAVVLVLAVILDMVIGDPRWIIHPVQMIGMMINRMELALRRYFITPQAERAAGILLALTVISVTFAAACLLQWAVLALGSHNSSPLIHILAISLLVLLTSTTIAAKGLLSACIGVINSVREGDIERARAGLSMIVGRDTAGLSPDEILKAAIETLSENLSDGVVAPIFYCMLGGFPLAMTYKAVNTLDSMVGYRNERYRYFGWASARIDDIANYIPARLTGLFIVIATATSGSAFINSLQTVIRDGRKHLSPNSGIPEAAMAGAVSVRLGGPSYYSGVLVEKPYIGETCNSDYLTASEESIVIARFTIAISAITLAGMLYLRGLL